MGSKMSLRGKTAVITGAGSGIGRALAISLARRHAHLALADINEASLAETADLLKAYDVRLSCHQVDVASPTAVEAFPAQVLAHHSGVDLLFNNAGVTTNGTFDQVSAERFNWVFEVNFHGLVRMTRTFLNLLHNSPDARLVNISSIFGIFAPPGQTAYVASKFAVRGFSESLRHELQDTTIGVTVVHPGGVATAISEKALNPETATPEEIEAYRAEARRLLTLPPAIAAETIIRGVEKRQDRVLVGSDAKAAELVVRLLPVSYWKLIKRFA